MRVESDHLRNLNRVQIFTFNIIEIFEQFKY